MFHCYYNFFIQNIKTDMSRLHFSKRQIVNDGILLLERRQTLSKQDLTSLANDSSLGRPRMQGETSELHRGRGGQRNFTPTSRRMGETMPPSPVIPGLRVLFWFQYRHEGFGSLTPPSPPSPVIHLGFSRLASQDLHSTPATPARFAA